MQNKLINRHKSRAVAMELLYSGTVNTRTGEVTDEFLDDFISLSETTENLDRGYIRKILNIAEGKENYLKAVIKPYLKDWDINRLSRVNLSILKIAVGELLFLDDIPDRVSLNEAIELSKTYSDEESSAFINGLLDKILKAKAQGNIPDEKTVEAAASVSAEAAAPAEPESQVNETAGEPETADVFAPKESASDDEASESVLNPAEDESAGPDAGIEAEEFELTDDTESNEATVLNESAPGELPES